MTESSRLIQGGIAIDSRGVVQHANLFDFANVDRFYTISPANNDVRGWVGHRREWKWFFAVAGAFEIGVVQPREWDRPASDESVQRFLLSAEMPVVLEVPPGSYSALQRLCHGAVLLVFSSGRIEEAQSDDFRLPADFWRMPSFCKP